MGNASTATGREHVVAAIPAYNEARDIAQVVAQARRFAGAVLVIDDGSTDDTARLAERAGATLIRHGRNLGKGAAIATAFAAAAARHADVLVVLDGDGQHDAREIPALVAPLLQDAADVCVGSRFLRRHAETPRYRAFGQRLLNVATWLGSGQACSDSQCGFRAFNRAAYSSMELRETLLHGLAVESEMQFEIARLGLRLAEAPVTVRYVGKARRNPLLHGLVVLYRVAALTMRRRRGLAVGLPASVASGLAVAALVWNVGAR